MTPIFENVPTIGGKSNPKASTIGQALSARLDPRERGPPRAHHFSLGAQEEMDYSEGGGQSNPQFAQYCEYHGMGLEPNFSEIDWQEWAMEVDQGFENLKQEIENIRGSAAIFVQSAEEKLKDMHKKKDDLVLNLQKHF